MHLQPSPFLYGTPETVNRLFLRSSILHGFGVFSSPKITFFITAALDELMSLIESCVEQAQRNWVDEFQDFRDSGTKPKGVDESKRLRRIQ